MSKPNIGKIVENEIKDGKADLIILKHYLNRMVEKASKSSTLSDIERIYLDCEVFIRIYNDFHPEAQINADNQLNVIL